MRKATNIFEVRSRVDRRAREDRNRHKGGVLWLTGLSGAGKSTLAIEVERALFNKGYHVYVLDGDNLRHGLNSNLGFSHEDRTENIRRVGEVAAAGFVCVSAFISPYRADREGARRAAGDSFHEIYVKADLETCESRDPKGLYERARRGEIPDFTGISAPYEEPEEPELVVDTARLDVEQSVAMILDYISTKLTLVDSKESA
jgi:bifunctional enzyme CysN/CysC